MYTKFYKFVLLIQAFPPQVKTFLTYLDLTKFYIFIDFLTRFAYTAINMSYFLRRNIMADYKNLTAEEVRNTLETVDYGTLTVENIWDMRKSLETEKNNFAENAKNQPSYNILADLAKEKLEALSPEDLEKMSPYELDSVKGLISAYASSNMGKFDGKNGELMDKISKLQSAGNAAAPEPAAAPAPQAENTAAPEPVNTADVKPVENVSAAPQETVTELADINDEKAPINKYNALEVMKKLNTLQPSELATLRRALNARPNEQTVAAGIALDEHILSQAEKCANGKESVVGIEEAYAFSELLELVKQYPNSNKVKENTQILDTALKQIKQEITAFEETYGLDKDNLQAPEIVEQNIAMLDGMPSDGQIFALELRPEKLQAPTDLQDVVGIIESAEASKSVPELSVLAGALQCKDLDEDRRKKLLEMAATRVKSTSALEHKDFKNFEYLLNAVKASPQALKDSVIKNKEQLLADARAAYKLQAPVKDKEFQDIYNVLNSLQIKGELKAFGRKTVDQNTKDSDLDLFREQIRRETEIYLANTSRNGISTEDFKQEYADRLRNNLVQLVYADKVSKGQISEKDFGKMFDEMATAAKDKKPIKINQESIIGWQAAKTNRLESAIKVEGKKTGYEAPAKAFSSRVKNLDDKLSKKYGALYSVLKTAAKSAGWGTAYSLAGATMGPAGVAMVATASFANTSWNYFKDYKKARNDAMVKGEKPDNLWNYMKKNKLKTAGVFMGAATVAIGIGGLGANAAVHAARAGSGMALAAAGAVNQGANAYKNTKGSKGQKLWAATKAIAVSGAAFAAAVWVGKEVNGIANEAYANNSNPTPPTPVNDSLQVDNNINVADSVNVTEPVQVADSVNTAAAAQPEIAPEQPAIAPEQPQISEPAAEPHAPQGVLAPEAEQEQPQEVTDWNQKIQDELHQGLNIDNQQPDGPEVPLRPDENTAASAPASSENAGNDASAPADAVAIDVNNLTDEQAHDIKMLFLRDPREANAILGQQGNDWMNSRELQESWDNGNITPEQKAELVKFAGERFDERGNFVGQDAEQMEAAAKAYSAAHNAAANNATPTEPAAQTAEGSTRNNEPLPEMSAITAKAETMEQNGLAAKAENPEQPKESDFEIKKIKINDDGTAKIVGTENGSRTTIKTDAANLDKSLQGYDKLKFHNNGDISVNETRGDMKVSYTVSEDGKITNGNVGGTAFEEAKIIDKNGNVDTSEPIKHHDQLVAGKEATESTIDKLKNLSGRGAGSSHNVNADKPAVTKVVLNSNNNTRG